MNERRLERSTDGGKTWEPCTALRGSVMFWAALRPDGTPVTDGFGNWYRIPQHLTTQP